MSETFEAWGREFDQRTQGQRNVLLFVDNCPTQAKIIGLKAIKLEFTPNTGHQCATTYGSRYHRKFQISSQKVCSSIHCRLHRQPWKKAGVKLKDQANAH